MKLPSDFMILDDALFRYIGKGKEVTVPAGIRAIDTDAFFNCAPVETLCLQEGVTEILDKAFSSCRNLRKLILPKSLKTIDVTAFTGCKALEEIVFPEGNPVFLYEDHVLYDKRRSVAFPLAGSVTIKAHFTKLTGVFETGTGVHNIVLEEGIEIIGNHAFNELRSLESLTLPNSLRRIGEGAFAGCLSLRSLQIPAGVLKFTPAALEYSYLEELDVSPDNPQIASYKGVLYHKDHTIMAIPPKIRILDLDPALPQPDLKTLQSLGSLKEIRWEKEDPAWRTENGMLIKDDAVVLIPPGIGTVRLPEGIKTIKDPLGSGYPYVDELYLAKDSDLNDPPLDTVFRRLKKIHADPENPYWMEYEDVLYRKDDPEATPLVPTETNTLVIPAFYEGKKLPVIQYHYLRRIRMEKPDQGILEGSDINGLYEIPGSYPLSHKIEDYFPRKTMRGFVRLHDPDQVFYISKSTIHLLPYNPADTEAYDRALLANEFSPSISAAGRIEAVGYRLLYPYGLSEKHRYDFEIFLANETRRLMYCAEYFKAKGFTRLFEIIMKDLPWTKAKIVEALERSHIKPPFDPDAYPDVLLDEETQLKAGYRAECLSLLAFHPLPRLLREVELPAVLMKDHAGIAPAELVVFAILTYAIDAGAREDSNFGLSLRNSEPLLADKAVNLLEEGSFQNLLGFLANHPAIDIQRDLHPFIFRYAGEETVEVLVRRILEEGIDDEVYLKALSYSNTDIALMEMALQQDLDSYIQKHSLQEQEVTYRLMEYWQNHFRSAVLRRPSPRRPQKALYRHGPAFTIIKKRLEKQLGRMHLCDGTIPAKDFKRYYLDLRSFRTMLTSKVIWAQGATTFAVNHEGLVRYDGSPYNLDPEIPVRTASVLEMGAEETNGWKEYLAGRKITQPFEQIHEPVPDLDDIDSGRYKDYGITREDLERDPLLRGLNGIEGGGAARMNESGISLYSTGGWWRGELVIRLMGFREKSRLACRQIVLLDRATVQKRLEENDRSVWYLLDSMSTEEIDERIRLAISHNASECAARLIEYRHKRQTEDPLRLQEL